MPIEGRPNIDAPLLLLLILLALFTKFLSFGGGFFKVSVVALWFGFLKEDDFEMMRSGSFLRLLLEAGSFEPLEI